MAIDPNSKAYNSLLNQGYTNEQITQMHNAAASGQSTQDIIANNPPINTPITIGPQNANLNYNQYGDDSNPAQQGQMGGMNEKYTGEGVKTSNLDYDPNITRADLDPNYLYGENARQQNRKEAGYIARRNDMIASALYNEGLTSKDDVANFLGQQNDWMNSTEADRMNTIESVWKRLGQIQPKEESKEPVNQNALNEDTAGKLYGKTTAEGGNPQQGIDIIADANSIYTQMNQARVANVNALRSMQPVNAATSTYYGTTPYGDQALRDVQNLDPEWYAQYQQELKKLYTQDKADTISHGSADDKKPSIVDSINETIVNDNKNFEEKNTTDESHEGAKSILETKLASNKVATSAKEEMLNIKKDIADLNSELDDLPNKAKKAFKGDVPDYIYQAYISNNRQELQKKIQNLENRYASLADIYKTEVSQAQREAEYQLKQAEYNRALTNDAYDREYKNKKLLQDSVQWVDGIPYMGDPISGTYIQLDDVTALNQYNSKVQTQSERGQSLVGKKTGLECEGYTDKQAQATAGVTMVGANGGATTAAEKVAYATNGGYIDANGNIVYGDANISDVIPQVGDIGVMVSNGKNKVSSKWGHTVYVDKVWQNENGEWIFHYTATNLGSGENEYTVGYERTVSLSDWMNNGGVGFRNPFKQAQYNGRSTDVDNPYSPMQPTIDRLMEEYKKSGKTNMFSELGKFQELYTNLYQADRDGTLSAMIDSGVLGTFLTNVAFNWAQNQGGDLALGDDKGVKNFLKLAGDEMLLEAESYVAKNGGFKDDPQAQKAYDGFRKMVRAIQIKLRDESGAAINKSERATDFLLFLPKASDSKALKESKLRDMEEYLRRMGTDAGINSKEYIPLNLGKTKERSYD